MAKTTTTRAKAAEPAPTSEERFSINRVQLRGRLTADPELRYTGSGKAVAQLRIATNERREAQYHTIVVWAEQGAEEAAAVFKRGQAVELRDGRLTYRRYESNGQQRTAVEIVAQTPVTGAEA